MWYGRCHVDLYNWPVPNMELLLTQIQFVLSSMFLCICVSMYLYCYLSTNTICWLPAAGAWGQFQECLKTTIESTQRYTSRPWMYEFVHAHGSRCWAQLDTHLQVIIVRTKGGTLALWSCKVGDAPGGHNCAKLKAICREDWRNALGYHNRANLEAIFRSIGRCSYRL
jgi:hypothetical protein